MTNFDLTNSFLNVEMKPVTVRSGRNRALEQISIQHRLKSNGKTEILIRIGCETMKKAGFKYSDSVRLDYGEKFDSHVFAISKIDAATKMDFALTLSKQNKSSDVSAAVIRFEFRDNYCLPNLIKKRELLTGKDIARVKFTASETTSVVSEGKLMFELSISEIEDFENEKSQR